ncbi:MAG: hypothetical protein HY735_32255 [Verrucomicrobia bacterium]|nr:hypothetical protein [Verrucomicrobiota bacterium]
MSMTNNWQSWTALAVVAITAAIMAYRVLVRKKTGCGEGCGCDASDKKSRLSRSKPPKTASEAR